MRGSASRRSRFENLTVAGQALKEPSTAAAVAAIQLLIGSERRFETEGSPLLGPYGRQIH
jgi:hypothetical protein